MDNRTLTIGDAGALLMGAGLAKLEDLYIGLALIGTGVLLKVLVAFLQKRGLDVQSSPLG